MRTIRPSTLATAVLLPALVAGLACAPTENIASGFEASIPDAVAEWKAAEPVTVWDTETIFDYINGHAEVYLAYGMKRSLARRYSGPEGEGDIVLDLFELASPEDAFGVFTHDLDGVPVGVGNGSLLRYGWLSYWQGPWFVSISSEMESDRASQAVIELGRAIAALLPAGGEAPAVVLALPPAGLDPRSVRFLRHPQILNTHLWIGDENLFGLDPGTAAALGKYARDDGSAYLLVIDYQSRPAAEDVREAFARRFLAGASDGEIAELEDDGWHGVRVVGSRLAAVLRADSQAIAGALLTEAVGGAE